MNILEHVHSRYVASRRANVLAERLAAIVPANVRLLDVGCGDGMIAWLLGRLRPDLRISGVDVLVRPDARMSVQRFDGRELPFGDEEFDAVMLVDVLHHCEEPLELLREACRVARRTAVIKDHLVHGIAASATLRFMDGVGNCRHGVSLPHNYWRPDQWAAAFQELGLSAETQSSRLGIYPWPLTLAFDRALHFMARLSVSPRVRGGHGAGAPRLDMAASGVE